MESIKDIHNNYDAVFKESFVLYKDKTLDFLGLDLAKIKEPLNTENTAVELKKSYSDLIFKLADNTCLHMEYEVDISKDDLLRFLIYSTETERQHKIPCVTVVFTNKKATTTSHKNRCVDFNPIIINLGERDGDGLLTKIKEQVQNGEKVNELELVYLPLYNSNRSVAEFFQEVLTIAPKVTNDKLEYQKIILLSLLVSNKFIPDNDLRKIWEVIDMIADEIKIIKFAEEKGREQGIEQGIEQVAINMLKKNIAVDIIIESTGLTEQQLKELQKKL